MDRVGKDLNTLINGSGSRMAMRFVLVTTNRGKAEEFSEIFTEYGFNFRVEPMAAPEIQENDLREIARYSVLYAYKVLREPVLVEDAGLFIKALNGFPGPYSSYVYKTIGVEGILKLMEGVVRRDARFESALAFYSPLTELKIFTGAVEGRISEEPRGREGFGFDPIFIPDGSVKTFAEMSLEEKNRLSHRARAARKFAEWFKTLKTLPPIYQD